MWIKWLSRFDPAVPSRAIYIVMKEVFRKIQLAGASRIDWERKSPIQKGKPGAPGWRSWLSVRLQPGHDLAVREFEPRVRLWADGSEPGACFPFCVSLSLCPSPVHALSLSVPKINKNVEKKLKKKVLSPFFLMSNLREVLSKLAHYCVSEMSGRTEIWVQHNSLDLDYTICP